MSAWPSWSCSRAATCIASRGTPPEVIRAPVDPAARDFVYFFALAPVAGDGPVRAVHAAGRRISSATPLVVLSGLAVIVAAGDRIRIEHQYLIGYAWVALLVLPPLLVALAIMIQPWIFAVDLQVGRPAGDDGAVLRRQLPAPHRPAARDRGRRSADSRRWWRSTAPSRPSLYLESAPESTAPRVDPAGHRATRARWCSGRRPTPPAGRRPTIAAAVSRIWCPRCRARSTARSFQGRMPLTAHRLGHDPRRARTAAIAPAQ